MSAFGQKRKSSKRAQRVRFPPKADMEKTSLHVGFWPQTGIDWRVSRVSLCQVQASFPRLSSSCLSLPFSFLKVKPQAERDKSQQFPDDVFHGCSAFQFFLLDQRQDQDCTPFFDGIDIELNPGPNAPSHLIGPFSWAQGDSDPPMPGRSRTSATRKGCDFC